MVANIALYDIDRTGFPNLALMKISAWHKSKGDEVEMFQPLLSSKYEKVYASKIFTYSSNHYLPVKKTELGGTGFDLSITLIDEIEHICPDYKLYGITDYSYGFLTRGCIRNCPWCIVPKKEGQIRPHADIDEFLRHENVIIMDNNILACDHGIKQIEKIAKLGIKVDFNQGLDVRLIDDSIARLLSKIKWIRFLRVACDSDQTMDATQKAVTLLRWHNVNPARIFVYCMLRNIDEDMDRVMFLKGLYLHVFAQPYRDFNGKKPSKELRDFARWINHKAIFKSVQWSSYKK